MSKRAATSDLNQDNWINEEKPEKMGTYQMAPSHELKMRNIKRAKRIGPTIDRESTSIFKNFKAFGNSGSESSVPSFSFLSGESTKPMPLSSFSFSKTNDSSKLNIPSEVVKPSEKKTTESLPLFSSNSASESNKPGTSSAPSMQKEDKEVFSKATFKFGLPTNKLSDPCPAPVSFNFNSSKSSESATKSTFKFGIDPKDDHSTTKSETHEDVQFKSSSNDGSPSLNFSSGNTNKEEPKASKVNGVESNSDPKSGKSKLFLANLKALNMGVVKWIKQHLDKNQYINLSPIFDDYQFHFNQIKNKYDPQNIKSSSATGKTKSTKLSPDSPKNDHTLVDTSDSENKTVPSLTKNVPTFKFEPPNDTPSKLDPPSTGQFNFTPSSKVTSPITKPSDSVAKQTETKPFSFFTSNSSSNNAASSQKTEANEPQTKSSAMFVFGVKDNSNPSFSFGSSSNTKPAFSFGGSEGSRSTSTFNFGAKTENKSIGFSFNKCDSPSSTSGFSFKPTASPKTTTGDEGEKPKDGEEASDNIPTVEVTEVKEEDAVYEKKVKLFYKKEDVYADKGVGTLFLKPAGDKTQLIVRALTNLGNILLNIILNDSIPTQRVGKNNVLLVCVPNPPIDTKTPDTPVSMLIRVKTEADADELLEKINQHKK